MRTDLWTVALLLFSSTPSLAHPQYIPTAELIARDADAEPNSPAHVYPDTEPEEFTYYSRETEERDLFKRKGGGGGGGRGGGGGSSSSGGKGGSSSSGSSRYVNEDFLILGARWEGESMWDMGLFEGVRVVLNHKGFCYGINI